VYAGSLKKKVHFDLKKNQFQGSSLSFSLLSSLPLTIPYFSSPSEAKDAHLGKRALPAPDVLPVSPAIRRMVCFILNKYSSLLPLTLFIPLFSNILLTFSHTAQGIPSTSTITWSSPP
jgi:hypothetical protein